MRGQDVFDGLVRLSHLKYIWTLLAAGVKYAQTNQPLPNLGGPCPMGNKSKFRSVQNRRVLTFTQTTTPKPISHKSYSTTRSSSYATIQRHRRVFPHPKIYAPEGGFRPYTKLLQAGDIFGPDEPSRVLRIASGVYRGIRVQKEQVGPVLVPSR